MVQISSEDSTKLQFRKLSDPDDSPLVSFYKHCFRYASPNLFIWGPLAPAHDALLARSAMARIQISVGFLIFVTTFRKYPSTVGTLRRAFVRLSSFTCGSALMLTGMRELTYFYHPNSNPLYVEIQLARELSLLDPANKGQPVKGSYWFGPKNFMPMNNEQYWKMVYSMEVNDIMADQYLESPLLTKCQALLDKNYGETSVVELKADELTSRIEDIVHRDTKEQEVHHSIVNDKNNKLFPLFENIEGSSKAKTLIYWTRNNPFDALQLQEYKEFYAYMFPRMHFEADTVRKENK